jgi:hypothetical protein
MLARQPVRANSKQRLVLRSVVMPAPVGGWDASSALAAMKKDRAVQLKNWFPQPGYVEVRRGYKYHAWDIASDTTPVETLMVWQGPASSKLFAAGGGKIWDVTSNAAASSAVTGLNEDRWQHTNMTTSAGAFLFCVNGTDAPRHYNGSTWATPSITGITASDVIHVNVHKKRLWFTIKDSTKAAYLATDAVAGSATEFNLGANFKRGGYLVGMTTWTRDGGSGSDDYAVFISSRGQAAVYQGTDPASASTWALVGVFDIPTPIGRRCFLTFGADVLLVTLEGVYPLSQVLSLDATQQGRRAITENISTAINADARSHAGNFGWELCSYAKGTRLILNIPTSETSSAKQYVMNTLTGAWCEFDGHNANAWCVYNDALYFAGSADGCVYRADTGSADIDQPITAIGQAAYQAFGNPGTNKRFSMLQCLTTASGANRPRLGMSADFLETNSLSTQANTGSAATSAVWDSAIWDSSTWPGEESNVNDWVTTPALGRFGSIKFYAQTGLLSGGSAWGVSLWGTALWGSQGSSDVTMRINGFVVLYETGGYL